MQSAVTNGRFLRSRPGRGFLLYLGLCAILAVGIGCGSYSTNLHWFIEHKREEKATALRLVDAFVTSYSAARSQFGAGAPVPATFRAHSIEEFNKQVGGDDAFRLRWVGRVGREIKTAPSDAAMASMIETFAAKADAAPISEFVPTDGLTFLRTVYPSYVRDQSCVNCHNELQPNKAQWRIGDLMGAFVIDVPVAPFLRESLRQSAAVGAALFLALAAIGFVFSKQLFRRMSERESAAAEIGRARKFLDSVVENMPALVTVKDIKANTFVLASRSAGELFGTSREDLVGKSLHDLFPAADAEMLDRRDEDVLRSPSKSMQGEFEIRVGDGSAHTFYVKKLIISEGDDAPEFLLTLAEDITERKNAEAQIAFLSHHDALTNLPNRAAFSARLASTLAGAAAAGERFTVMCIDLDRFKEVNDIFGHPVGDAMLRTVSARLQGAAQGAFIARIGGDEFSLIFPAGGETDLAEALANRLQASIAGDLEVEGHQLRTGLSIGVAIYPADGSTAEALIVNADAALYRAKAEGRGRTRFFDVEMDMRLRERRALQHDLRAALTRNEFVLHYQPQSEIDGDVVGMEALVRWNHPTRGLVAPDVFIPLAEESGIIIALGEWILREACREAASWPRPLRVGVNLSPIQFRQGNLSELLLSVLLETGLAANRLELEITEGVLVEDFSRAVSILGRLKALGVRVAMDDFGTGYSSLSYLQSFPFDRIKIDKSFISNLHSNAQSAAIVCAVIGLARGLKLPVIAEGVETRDQLSFLKRQACQEVQGYFIGRPQPICRYADMVGRAAAPLTAVG